MKNEENHQELASQKSGVNQHISASQIIQENHICLANHHNRENR